MPTPLPPAAPAAPPSRIVVIGGGVIGLCAAIAARRRGLAVTLIEAVADPRGASWGNAGHIAVEQAEPIASPHLIRTVAGRLFCRGGPVALPPRAIRHWLPFGLRLIRSATPARFAAGTAALAPLLAGALPAWQRLLADAGRADLLRADGHFVLWESAATARAGRAAWARADTGTAQVRDATAAERAMIDARLARPVAGAIRFDGSGRITDLAALATTLRAHLIALGGRILTATATGLPAGGGVRLANGRRLPADRIVVAAGVASRPLLARIGHDVPMIAERGYHLTVPDPDWPADLPPLVFEDRAMIVTRFATGLRAAGFVEYGAADAPPDPRKWQRLRRHAAALGLPFPADGGRPWMGARPTLPDYLPAIGRSLRAPHVHYAFGHNHLGLTLAAITGEIVADALAGRPGAIATAPFDLARFG